MLVLTAVFRLSCVYVNFANQKISKRFSIVRQKKEEEKEKTRFKKPYGEVEERQNTEFLC